jgi:hypothetical protein
VLSVRSRKEISRVCDNRAMRKRIHAYLAAIFLLTVASSARPHTGTTEPKPLRDGSVYVLTEPTEAHLTSDLSGSSTFGLPEVRRKLKRGETLSCSDEKLYLCVAWHTDRRLGNMGPLKGRVEGERILLDIETWHDGPLYRNVVPGILVSSSFGLENPKGVYEVLLGGTSVGFLEITR